MRRVESGPDHADCQIWTDLSTYQIVTIWRKLTQLASVFEKLREIHLLLVLFICKNGNSELLQTSIDNCKDRLRLVDSGSSTILKRPRMIYFQVTTGSNTRTRRFGLDNQRQSLKIAHPANNYCYIMLIYRPIRLRS